MENQQQNQQPGEWGAHQPGQASPENEQQNGSQQKNPDRYGQEDTDAEQNDIAGNAGGNQQDSGSQRDDDSATGGSDTDDEDAQWEDEDDEEQQTDNNEGEEDDDDELSTTD